MVQKERMSLTLQEIAFHDSALVMLGKTLLTILHYRNPVQNGLMGFMKKMLLVKCTFTISYQNSMEIL